MAKSGIQDEDPMGRGAELTLIHEHLPDEDARRSHEAGWSGLFDKLSVFLESAK